MIDVSIPALPVHRAKGEGIAVQFMICGICANECNLGGEDLKI